jgi:Leucine-rich repeat (LRR) protein
MNPDTVFVQQGNSSSVTISSVVSIPSNLGELKSLTYLSLFTNRLNRIASFVVGAVKSERAEFVGERFCWYDPGTWSKLNYLEHIDLVQVTDLSGTIPSSFTLLTSLKWLRLDDTSVEGSITDVIGKFPSLGT